jgi:hypothetical protein
MGRGGRFGLRGKWRGNVGAAGPRKGEGAGGLLLLPYWAEWSTGPRGEAAAVLLLGYRARAGPVALVGLFGERWAASSGQQVEREEIEPGTVSMPIIPFPFSILHAIHVYVSIYIAILIYIHTFEYTHICIHTYTFMYTCLSMYLSVFLYI